MTGELEGSVANIFAYLFRQYGKMSSKTLLEKQNDFNNYVYDINTPIDVFFRTVEDYTEYATFSGSPVPTATIIMTAYEVLRRTNKFKSDLIKWKELPQGQQTWNNFKSHFRNAVQTLQEFSNDTAEDAGYANNMVEQITSNVANLMQSDGGSNEGAQQFLQNLSQAVVWNQQSLSQITDQFNNLSAQLHSLNAASNAPLNNNNQGTLCPR